MFSKLWKAPSNAVMPESFEFEIPRQTREPLRFNGRLEFESNGCDVGTYRFGDPYHRLRLYKLLSAGYAAIVEFHLAADTFIVDAAIVDSTSDVDDFFCLHAGDQFHRLALHGDIDAEPDKELERRVLACYDRQLLELMNHLEKINDGRANS